MATEGFNPEKLKGVSVSSVFGAEANGARIAAPTRKKLSSIEQARLSPNSEPTLLFDMATAVTNGDSILSISREYGMHHHSVSKLLRAANIPYATREEAVQRLWNDPDFRTRNRAAVNKGIEEVWKDPKKSDEARKRNSKAATKGWSDPTYRANSSVTHQALWEDPEYRASQMKAAADGKNTPQAKANMSAAKRATWQNPEYRAKHLPILLEH